MSIFYIILLITVCSMLNFFILSIIEIWFKFNTNQLTSIETLAAIHKNKWRFHKDNAAELEFFALSRLKKEICNNQ